MLTQRNLADVYHSFNTFNISVKTMTYLTEQIKRRISRVPVLILRGDRDYVVTEQMTKEIVRRPLGDNATYIPLKDTGHSPLVDDLPRLKELIETFLD